MIDTKDLPALLALLQAHGVAIFEWEGPRQALLQVRFAEPATAREVGVPDSVGPGLAVLPSSGFGEFRSRHPLVSEIGPYEAGSVVKGQIVAFLQAGEVLFPIEADRDGIVARVLVQDGALVGYGAPVLEWQSGQSG